MVKAALVALAIIATPAISYACLNGTEWTIKDDIRLVQRAEKQFEEGRFGAALKSIQWLRPASAPLRQRIKDLKAIIEIRVHDDKADLSKSVAHIEKRDDDANHKEIKFLAWRAEAYVAVGRLDEAKKILDDLHTRDLMPDAYGYLALAKLTSGATRLEMWKACRTRAKDKDMCELPKVSVSASANAK